MTKSAKVLKLLKLAQLKDELQSSALSVEIARKVFNAKMAAFSEKLQIEPDGRKRAKIIDQARDFYKEYHVLLETVLSEATQTYTKTRPSKGVV
ncbi:MAG: hypothetical protein HY376_00195 [Candidatus Blackburnbacteria bacterium]|nr:hypothetical protein [Candidatus Blackburnbacteria bacterium]